MVIPKIRIINNSNSAPIEREMNMANTAEESARERKTRHAISTWQSTRRKIIYVENKKKIRTV
jgi:hypothetical protein